MDLALLAVTALGFVGVFLMLPRQQVSLARLGALVAVLALGGLFLVLVRTASDLQAAGELAAGPPILFYVFAAIMIIGAVGVVTQPRPVYAALYFVLVTLAGAGIFVLLLAEFMAIVLVIVYAGAILVTYVFVIMLASQGQRTPEYDRIAAGPLWAVMVSFILVGTVLMALFPTSGAPFIEHRASAADPLMVVSLGAENVGPGEAPVQEAQAGQAQQVRAVAAAQAMPRMNNVQLLGAALYGNYAYSLELAGFLLTIALVGAVVMSRKNVDAPRELGTGRVPTE